MNRWIDVWVGNVKPQTMFSNRGEKKEMWLLGIQESQQTHVSQVVEHYIISIFSMCDR